MRIRSVRKNPDRKSGIPKPPVSKTQVSVGAQGTNLSSIFRSGAGPHPRVPNGGRFYCLFPSVVERRLVAAPRSLHEVAPMTVLGVPVTNLPCLNRRSGNPDRKGSVDVFSSRLTLWSLQTQECPPTPPLRQFGMEASGHKERLGTLPDTA